MKNSTTFKQTLVSTAITLLIAPAFAGPGALINSPLFINATVASNIMFVVDNSRSMEHVAEEDFSTTPDPDKYDKTKTYIDNCSSPVSNSSSISYFIYINGADPKVRTSINSGTEETVSYNPTNNNSTGSICFNPTLNYKAGLHATSGSQPQYDFTALYTGNYLNWYFTKNNTSNTGGSVGSTTWNSTSQRIKPGTKTRKTIAAESLTTLVTALEASDVDIRLGLTTFGTTASTQGAYIFDDIKYLDTTQRDNINNHLGNLGYGSGTPLARTMHQLGNYFIGESGSAGANYGNLPPTALVNDTNGGYSGNLNLHPDATTPLSVSNSTVFGRTPNPVNLTRESPIQYWCQNNFAVVMTDGLPTVDRADIPTQLQDYDNDCNGASPPCNNPNTTLLNASTGLPNPTYDMKDNSSYLYELEVYSPSDYFDDVAQALYEIDLRPDIDDYSGNDVKNNLVTYTIAFADQDALNNKLITDAGTQGGGEAISAADGQDLIRKFTQVTNKILATTSSAAAVTFNTSTLGSDTAVYQALFSTSRWSGDIFSYPVDPTNGDILFSCTVDTTANCWSAATHLDALAYNNATSSFVDNRQIITFDAANKKGIPFTTPGDFTAPGTNEITAAMISDLCAGPDAPLVAGVACTSATATAKTNSQTYVDRMVDYIRGDRTYENISTTPTFRTRQTILGDIINATPAFVGAPKLPWPTIDDATNKFGEGFPALPLNSGKRYSDFKTAQNNRTKALYVSANDGMLHAFRTESTVSGALREKGGDELFAFIPSFVFSNQANQGLHHLTEPTYTHKYYLDLSPTYTDIYGRVKDSSNSSIAPFYATATNAWHTILIGGSRGGAKRGIFALDITDPDSITQANAANKVLWEFTNVDDVDLGYTYSKPTIALTNAVGTDGLNRWAAIFGNGYQDDTSAVGTGGTSCHAVLYIVFLDGGLDGTWTLGTNPSTADYMKIDTGVGSNLTAGGCNGLSTPALVDTDGDKIVDRVYAGDVKGNMWAFDLTCGGSCAFDIPYTQGGNPKPLFTAKDSQATPAIQPIMEKPSIARNTAVTSTTPNQPNLLVLFGTGQYHTANDNAGTTKINTFYGIWDSGTSQLTDNRANDTSTGSKLVGQTLTTTTTAYGQIRNITSNTIDWTKKYGWYIDLAAKNTSTNEAEERVVVSPAIRSDVIFFNTLIPNSQKCGFGGSGWLMSVDLNTGGTPKSTVFDVNGDNVVDASDNIGGQIAVGAKFDGIPADSSFIGDNQYTQSSDKSIDKRKISVAPGLREGRLSWRELRADN